MEDKEKIAELYYNFTAKQAWKLAGYEGEIFIASKEFADKACDLFPKAGEDGLLTTDNINNLLELEDGNNHCMYQHDIEIAKAQKALDDKWVLDRVVEITDQWDNKTPVTLYHLNITKEEYLKLKGGNNETG